MVIGNGAEKRVVQAKVWDSEKRKAATGREIIYDGNKLAWSTRKLGQIKAMVDLDEEAGRGPSRDGRNAFRIHISQTKTLDPTVLLAYLQGKIQFNTNVLEAVNFMDHLLREGPSRNADLIAVKRSFFKRQGQKTDLSGGVEVWRGVYQSMRVAQGGRMIVNLDVSNTAFWISQSVINTIVQKAGFRDPGDLAAKFRDVNQRKAVQKWLKKLSVQARYQGNKQPNTVWKIDAIADVNPNQHMIKVRDPQTGQETNEQISVTAYFKRKYNVNLSMPQLPMIRMTKKMRGEPIYFPMELLFLTSFQRYGAKLDEKQTANMIKFAVSPPAARKAAIADGKSWLNWDTDPHIQNYGLRINHQPIVTQARVLPPPGVRFGKGRTETSGTKGRWDLRGKEFLQGNPTELTSWGVGIFRGRTRLDQGALEKFAMDFVKQYRGHGGRVVNGPPLIMQLKNDAGQAVQELHQGTGTKFQKRPELLIFLLQDRNSFHYERIKKSCDCRYGVMSQCMQAAQVQKGNPQYYSNVLMKVNAKLGGTTSQAASAPQSGFKGWNTPTAFIGADVSHASPGSDAASLAAITLSFDKFAARYAAGVQTNGRRVEMITEKNWYKVLGPLLGGWTTDVGGGRPPAQIYYIRDGVSEGQFVKVIQEEVPHIRGVLNKLSNGKWDGKITVLVASKRHHIRAFPNQNDGDNKGNPLPGTLIEKDVTMPQEFDFFLYSHIALQGTSRPVHYTVLLDEANHPPAALQNMIYEHCYQYMRSTTSVSQHPAAYYAHLASKRAVSHVNVSAAAGPQTGAGMKANQPTGSSDTPRSSEVPDLLEMYEAGNKIKWSMWYI